MLKAFFVSRDVYLTGKLFGQCGVTDCELGWEDVGCHEHPCKRANGKRLLRSLCF
jgi:hypothetical protein